MESSFINELNHAIKEGIPPPKSKLAELVPKIAASLHVLHHVTNNIRNNLDTPYSEEVPIEIFQSAKHYVESCEQQKETFSSVSSSTYLWLFI